MSMIERMASELIEGSSIDVVARDAMDGVNLAKEIEERFRNIATQLHLGKLPSPDIERRLTQAHAALEKVREILHSV